MNGGATRAASSFSEPDDTTNPGVVEAAARELRCATTGLKKTFGGNAILKGVDLEIPEGSFAVLVGPSGCGKSTLLRLLAGLEQADEGKIFLAGRDVTQLPPRDRDIAMVFQSYALYPHLSVRDNLAFGLRLRGTPERDIAARIEEASAMLGLSTLLQRLPKQLSGGQRQRVAMGRAIVRRPSLFLFDEPLSNLDAALRAEVRVEIRRLHERLGATTVYVTHDQVEAMTLADSLWVLNAGRVEQRGAPLDIYDRPRTKFVAGFLGSPKMNFLTGSVVSRDAELRVMAEGLLARIAPPPAHGKSKIVDGQPVTIGIRPHDVNVARDAAEKACDLLVTFVEALGSEAFAHGTLSDGGPTFTARIDANDARSIRPSSTVPLAIRPGGVHLFDPSSDRSVLYAE